MGEVTEVSEESWFGRIGNSIKGILTGIVLFFAAFPLLWWNEGNFVETMKSLAEGRGAVVEASPDSVDPSQDEALIHVVGEATTDEALTDPKFGIEVQPAIKLRRSVEMYQWQEHEETETEKKIGGGTKKVTTYSYDKQWVGHSVDSAQFKESQGHENPPMPFQGDHWTADEVNLGAYSLSDGLVGQIDAYEPHTPDEGTLADLPEQMAERPLHTQGSTLYLGESPDAPTVGDMRVDFQVVEPTEVSVIGQQVGDAIGPYPTSVGRELEMLSVGSVSADQMFTEAENAATTMVWILRLVGWLAMGAGIYLVLRPMEVMADVLPFLGDLIGMGLMLVAGVISFGLSLITISIAWVFFRPMIGIPLLVVGLLAVGTIVAKAMMGGGNESSAEAAKTE